MTESNEFPKSDLIRAGEVPLESILCTEELRRRPSRPPDYQKENRALLALSNALAYRPTTSPSFAVVTEGKTSEIKVARTLRFAPGTILAIDRGYVDYQWFRELTQEEVYFVTRMKEKAVYEVQEEVRVPQNSNVVCDQIISFPRLAREGENPVLFRRVEIWDKEKEEAIVFLSNMLAFGATTIAAIYKDRWEVELFFKGLKQLCKIKTFVGTSANAVKTQVWTALIAMLVLKYLQLKSSFSWSLSTLAALLRQQLFFYRDLWVWLDDPFQSPPALAGVHDDAQQLKITW